jgi:hypothetical protein
MTLALMGAAIVVEWREPRQGGGLLAADLAEFGHTKQQGERGALTDAGHALDEVEATAEIVVPGGSTTCCDGRFGPWPIVVAAIGVECGDGSSFWRMDADNGRQEDDVRR